MGDNVRLRNEVVDQVRVGDCPLEIVGRSEFVGDRSAAVDVPFLDVEIIVGLEIIEYSHIIPAMWPPMKPAPPVTRTSIGTRSYGRYKNDAHQR